MMKIVISPAKTFAEAIAIPYKGTVSVPFFHREAQALAQTLKTMPIAALETLMHISPKLAKLNHERWQAWQSAPTKLATLAPPNKPKPAASSRKTPVDAPQPAIFAFNGDVYRGLNIARYTASQLKKLNNSLWILSGLYGMLQPLDGIHPYRLEMGTALQTEKGKNLYEFWQDRPAQKIITALKPTEPLINLASEEYFRVIKPYIKAVTVITPIFKENKAGIYKVVSFKAKYARGLMTSFIVKNNISRPEEIKKFACAGYRYAAQASTPLHPTFVRD